MKHAGTMELHSERLVLRRFRKTDAEAVCGSWLNEEAFLYYANKEATSLEREIEILSGVEESYGSREYYNWLITLKDGTVIGAINLRADNESGSLEFNYAIAHRYQNKGYMTEALNTVKAFAVGELDAVRFFGGCAENNIASGRVMEKCGLKPEGIIKNGLLLKDGYHDMTVYSYVKGEGSSRK